MEEYAVRQGEKNMSKTQEIEYKKYVIEKEVGNRSLDECDREKILEKEEWLAVEEQREAEEEQAYHKA